VQQPLNPKIYHIVHIDRLQSIVADGYLFCDAAIVKKNPPGTTIGMNRIKERRLTSKLSSYDLNVGDCVPFYFCPRSVMLYLLSRGNHQDIHYHGGQEAIIHFEADMAAVVGWAEKNHQRWLFTLSNAGSNYFEERTDLKRICDLDWNAIQENDWSACKEGKQAEFLIEQMFPFYLVDRIGVFSQSILEQVELALRDCRINAPQIEVIRNWYY
jgi:hypothetical protein